MKVYTRVPVEEFEMPENWINPDMEDPDYNPQDHFAIGWDGVLQTIWSKEHLIGVTHVLVEKDLICFTPDELETLLNQFGNFSLEKGKFMATSNAVAGMASAFLVKKELHITNYNPPIK